MASGEYKYFPEITLACRVENYTEFAKNIGIDNAVDRDDAQFVPGLKVLSERLPYEGYRARHANLTKIQMQILSELTETIGLRYLMKAMKIFGKKHKRTKKNLKIDSPVYCYIFGKRIWG